MDMNAEADVTVFPIQRVSRLQRWKLRVAVLLELFRSLIRGGRLWLVPMLVIFLLAGVLLGVVQVIEYVAPFVYTMF